MGKKEKRRESGGGKRERGGENVREIERMYASVKISQIPA